MAAQSLKSDTSINKKFDTNKNKIGFFAHENFVKFYYKSVQLIHKKKSFTVYAQKKRCFLAGSFFTA